MALKNFLLTFLTVVTSGSTFGAEHSATNVIDMLSNVSNRHGFNFTGNCLPGERCVPYYHCHDTDGSMHFNIRTALDDDVPCESLQQCCGEDFIDDNVGKRMKKNKVADKCGQRNSNGVGSSATVSSNESQFGEFPWMVAVLVRNKIGSKVVAVYVAGGSLIHPSVVLSAAHNHNSFDPRALLVRAGEWNTQSLYELLPYVERDVKEITYHEDFNLDNMHNDICLIFLQEPFKKEPHINIVCLPQPEFNHTGDCFGMGWGKDKFGKIGIYQAFLKKIVLPFVRPEKCEERLRKTILGEDFILNKGFICAGGEEGIDTCTGDGGSPLVCPISNEHDIYYQAGIVSWGISCNKGDVPGVYIDVMKFKPWITAKAFEKDFVI